MREVKPFDEFIKKGVVRKVSPDLKMAASFKVKAEKKNKFLNSLKN